MGQPGLFFVYFQSFQTNNIIFTTNQCEKMSCPSSLRRLDSNPQPLERESPPITTRPGLQPYPSEIVYLSARTIKEGLESAVKIKIWLSKINRNVG